jgi:5'-3' exonuclease
MEQARRRAEREKMISKMKEAKRILVIVEKEYGPKNLKIDGHLKKEIELLFSNRKNKEYKIDFSEPIDVIPELKTLIEKYYRQTLPITDEYKEKAKKIVNILGLAVLQADGEAETLCAYLAIKGEVDAVLSEDTDVLAYGTPLLLSKIDIVKEKVTTILHKNIRSCTGFSTEEFRDLCILLSCDYNSRVIGFPPECSKHEKHRKAKKPVHIGAKAAVCMIDAYRNLEEVERHVVDTDPLNYRRCRELFTVPDTIPYIVVPYNQPIREEELRSFLKENKCAISIKFILDKWKPVPMVFDDDEEEKNDENDNSDIDKLVEEFDNPESDYYKLMEKIARIE